MTNEELLRHVEGIADSLIEHGDAVLVLVSLDDSEETFCIHARRGSWHTILGVMEDYKRKTLAGNVIKFLKEDDDGGS